MSDRLFLALPLPDGAQRDLQRHLAAALAGEPLPGRAVVPQNWHFTLRFLGETSEAAQARLVTMLDGAALGGAFAVGLGAPGAFPRAARAAVLWVGAEQGAAPLAALAARVEEAVRQAGFPPEARPFAAHLTLSRLQPPRDLRALLQRLPPADVRFPAEHVVLFRSHLGGGSPRYQALHRWPLTPPPA